MKTIKLTLLITIVLSMFNICYGQSSQWDLYNLIPTYKNISVVFNKEDVRATGEISGYGGVKKSTENYNLIMTIHDDYTVSLDYSTKLNLIISSDYVDGSWFMSHMTTNETVSIIGNGILLWKNDKVVLQLNIKEKFSGWYKYENTTVSTTKYSYLLGVNYEVNNSGHSEFNIPRHEKSYTYNYDVYLTSEDGVAYISFDGNTIQSTINGHYKLVNDQTSVTLQNCQITYNTYIGLSDHRLQCSINPKSESELNAENSDVYGKWQWNDDRSVIYLGSTTGDDYLVLWNKGGNLSWGFQMDNASHGYKTETAETGDELTYMMLSFDGSSEQSFAFAKMNNTDTLAISENTDKTNYEYVLYDRFAGKLKRTSSILEQVKDKRIMVVNYKLNDIDKTAMFQLEGLEAIYNALTAKDDE